MDITASPQILKSPIPEKNVEETQKHFSSWFKKNIVKIIIAVLGFGVVLELIFGGRNLFSPSSAGKFNILAPRINELSSASLSLIPDQASYRSGDEIEIDVKLFTGGHMTDSTDLIIKYDPAFLAPGSDGFAVEGNLYSEYPAMQIDKEKGLIGISGITLPSSGSFSGVGSFASLYFTALKDGQTTVSVEYVPDATNDSNVVLSGSAKDILGVIKNADILISGVDTQTPVKKDQSCASFTQYCQDGSGNTGTQVCSGGSTKNGSCSYDPEFTQNCGVCKI